MADLNWDDLRVVEALAARGRFAGAASELGVDETTVARRLRRLERTLSVVLFEARDGGWVASAAGRTILDHIADIRRHVGTIEATGRAAGGVGGRIRLAATPLLAQMLLVPRLAGLLAQHPKVQIELLTGTGNVDFARWEADFAIRLMRPERGDFLVSKLSSIPLFMVGPRDPAAAETALLCVFPDSLGALPEMRALRRLGLEGTARLITDDLAVVRSMVRSHTARAILPAYVCRDLRADAGLVFEPMIETREAWLLMQPHLKGSQTASVVADWIRDALAGIAEAGGDARAP